MQSLLSDLQTWYAAQCDGDWEHSYGIEITTLDNPGWRLTVNLEGTILKEMDFTPIERKESEQKWIECHVENNTFIGGTGADQLEELISIFLDWAKTEPDWLAVEYETKVKRREMSDKDLWVRLREETGSAKLAANTNALLIVHSARNITLR